MSLIANLDCWVGVLELCLQQQMRELFCVLQWGYELGQASEMKVSIPLHGCEHFYLLTKPLQEPLPSNAPGLALQTQEY